MKKLLILSLIYIFSLTTFAESYNKEKEIWTKSVRSTIEIEDYSGDYGEKAEDQALWGIGLNFSKGKISHDFNIETRNGGNLPTKVEGWKGDRVDYKLRYKILDNVGVHIKFRVENRDKVEERADEFWQENNQRKRIELGGDWYEAFGTNGWFVIGRDQDEPEVGDKTQGTYWEGDFGPSYSISEKLSLQPTFYLNGEFYDGIYGYRMQDYQLRIMARYKVNDKFTIMPRVRFSIFRKQKNWSEVNEGYIDAYNAFGRTRFELLGTNQLTSNTSTFWGLAYDIQDRELTTGENKDFDMFWLYLQVTHVF